MKKRKSKGLSVVRTAQMMANRLASSRHQRRKLEKLAKKYRQEFIHAATVKEKK